MSERLGRVWPYVGLFLLLHACGVPEEYAEEVAASSPAPSDGAGVISEALSCVGGTTYEAESMVHSTGGATTGGWNLWSNGYLATNHDFAQATTIRVIARGMPAAGVWPQMSVAVGGSLVGTVSVSSGAWTEYAFNVAPGVGTKEIRVSFGNDYLSESEDRNLLVDKLVVGCAAAASGSFPRDPIAFEAGKTLSFQSASGLTHYAYVPAAYDVTHRTPMNMLVWLHGCGGYSKYDIELVSPGGTYQTWISLTVGGAEGGCWNTSTDGAKVFEAITAMETHFNIDPRRVVLGGYSSGGDLTYRMAFYHASQFAGVLVANSAPFYGTGAPQSALLGAAAWKFPVVHLAHLGDTTYPIALVRRETDAVQASGHPMRRIERAGNHWDNANVVVNGQVVPGTKADIIGDLLPYLKASWASP